MIRCFVLMLVLVVTMLGIVTAEEKKGFDPEKIVGEWEFVSGTKAGNKIEKIGGTIQITKETISMSLNEMKFVFGYKLPEKGSPAKLEMTTKESPFGKSDDIVKGLIELKNDELTILYVFSFDKKEVEIPKKLESTEENKAHLFVLKRVKK